MGHAANFSQSTAEHRSAVSDRLDSDAIVNHSHSTSHRLSLVKTNILTCDAQQQMSCMHLNTLTQMYIKQAMFDIYGREGKVKYTVCVAFLNDLSVQRNWSKAETSMQIQ